MDKVIIINNETFGQGNEVLGKRLMGAFLRKLWGREEKPESIIFYNSGVKLLAEGSMVLDALLALFEDGVDLIACGTCIDEYQLKDKIIVGRISDMEEIANTLMDSNSVVTI